MTFENRAGQYIRQPTGYRAFLPNPLPPQPPVEIRDELLATLSRADRALGRLDGSIQTLPNPDLFVLMYVRKEAVLSSQIEGTQSSLNDVLEVEARIFRKRRPGDVNDVINYTKAMNHGLERLSTLPVSVRLIKEIHAQLLNEVRGDRHRPGELRQTQNWIGPKGCTLDEAIFIPPPPGELQNTLSALERFMRGQEVLPTLVRIGLVHAQFETIHPFLDGNGRIGRLLITFLLCERKILLRPVLYLSHYFKEHRQQYYELLQRTRTHGEWEQWIQFFLDAIATVANEATETARLIVGLREEHRRIITNDFGRTAGNATNVLESLYERPLVNVNDVARLTKLSYPAANDLVHRFVEAGILNEITGMGRNRLFRYSSYIRLFSVN